MTAETFAQDIKTRLAYAFMPTVSATKVAKGIPQKYFAYAKVFSKEKANKPLPKGT